MTAITATPIEELWSQVLDDPYLAALPHKIEIFAGRVVMSPPPLVSHSYYAGRIALLLNQLMTGGRAGEPIGVYVPDGVNVTDAYWISRERLKGTFRQKALTLAPEICVEVLSRGNSEQEMRDKQRDYLNAGAIEFWRCDLHGRMSFFLTATGAAHDRSVLCPAFPLSVVDTSDLE